MNQSPPPETDLRKWLAGILCSIYKELPDEPVWQWAERTITLGGKESIEHSGPYDSSLTPYTRWLMEQFRDNSVREFFLAKSSQTGVTLALLIGLAYTVVHNPRNAIYAINSREEAKKISKQRIQPMLRDCGDTKHIVAKEEAADNMSNMTMHLGPMVLHLIGSFTAGPFRNKSVAWGILDEYDAHPENIEGEGSSLDLLRSRLKAVRNSKLFCLSKPTMADKGIWPEYMTGTQHKLFVPCPHCGLKQVLEFERLQFSHCREPDGTWDVDRILKETYYLCEAGCHIEERHKRKMVLDGEWRATAKPNKSGKVSAHISDLYSQFASARWGVLVQEFLDSKKTTEKLRTFYNERLGKPYEDKAGRVAEHHVLARRGGYMRGHVPVECAAALMAVDVQESTLKWVKCGIAKPNLDLYVSDYGEVLSYDDILLQAQDGVMQPDGQIIPVRSALIDEGYGNRTTEVRQFCMAQIMAGNGIFWPCKGRGGLQVKGNVTTSLKEVGSEQIMTYHFDDDGFKRSLYTHSLAKFNEEQARKYHQPALFFPADIDPEFVWEFTTEKWAEKVLKSGFSKWGWEMASNGKNDYADCVKMLFVLRTILSIVDPTFGASGRKSIPMIEKEPEKQAV